MQKSSFPPQLVALLQSVRQLTVLTGAGISAESGIPTFRDALTGLWAQYQAEDLATPQAFRRDPKLVWEWYAWRRERADLAQPNPGHLALVAMERRIPGFLLVTQNVDGLHQRAGSKSVIELHGNIGRVKCSRNVTHYLGPPVGAGAPPPCPHCGAPLRPDVVWFGENLPEEALERAFVAAQNCQVLFSVGTSGVVQPAASLPWIAQDAGATVIEVNAEATPLSERADYVLTGPAGIILPTLIEKVWGIKA